MIPDWSRYHILIVEDDILSFELVKELLKNTKIRITHAITGLEAVKFCRKDSTFDLILMDMRLPELDGYQATTKIKEFRPDLVVIANTAHALYEDEKKCKDAGCDFYITKPIDRVLLFNTIGSIIS